MQTGIINPYEMTFDIAGVGETETSILLTPQQLQLTYRNEDGQLIRFVKAIPATYYKKLLQQDPRLVQIGTSLTSTVDGCLKPGKRKPIVAKSLIALNWDDLSTFTNKTIDGRRAALIPVMI